jgi:hypothetical protein
MRIQLARGSPITPQMGLFSLCRIRSRELGLAQKLMKHTHFLISFRARRFGDADETAKSDSWTRDSWAGWKASKNEETSPYPLTPNP